MKKGLVLLFAIALSSCSPKFYSLKGNYPKPPFSFHTDKSVEKVWDNLIDFFAQNGLSIKIIDRSSGLIVSDKTNLQWTTEDKFGKLKNAQAVVVLPVIYFPNQEKPLFPFAVTGEWNVRIKKSGEGTDINVNLLNFNADYGSRESNSYLQYQSLKSKFQGSIDGVTTGVFEKFISDKIK